MLVKSYTPLSNPQAKRKIYSQYYCLMSTDEPTKRTTVKSRAMLISRPGKIYDKKSIKENYPNLEKFSLSHQSKYSFL